MLSIEIISKVLFDKLPSDLYTFSRAVFFSVNILNKEILTIKSGDRYFKVNIHDFYALLVKVETFKTFESKYFNDKHKYYLLPLAELVLRELEEDVDLLYAPPKGGWKKRPTILFQPESMMNFSQKMKIGNSAPIEMEEGCCVVPIHYATNRQRKGDKFLNVSGYEINYGLVNVSIPERFHKSGRIETPIKLFGIKINESRKRHFFVDSSYQLTKDAFYTSLESMSADKNLMIFVHGYNVGFDDAIFRCAQLKYDLNYTSPVMLFSWPSRDGVGSYVSDKESALGAAKLFRMILEELNSKNFDNIVIVGHSMGTFCLVEALLNAKITTKKYTRLVLAAADIQKNDFINIYSHAVKAIFSEICLYISSFDLALSLSKLTNQSSRVGDKNDGIVVVDGFETIDISESTKNIFSLGHSYVSEDNRVLDDLFNFLISGIPASKRRLKERENLEKKKYWELP